MELSPAMKECFPELADYNHADFSNVAITKPTIMVAMTARTGSTHLCSALSNTCGFGEVTEIFNPRGPVQELKNRRSASSFSDYMKSFNSEPTVYFGFKVAWLDFASFSQYYKTIFPNLRVFYLNRFDIEAQAISTFRAKITGIWHDAPHMPKPLKNIPDEELIRKFDLRAICRTIKELEAEKVNWENFFFNEGMNVPRIHYEQFENDVNIALKFFFRCFDISCDGAAEVKSDFRKISDKTSEAWLIALKQFRYAIKLPANVPAS